MRKKVGRIQVKMYRDENGHINQSNRIVIGKHGVSTIEMSSVVGGLSLGIVSQLNRDNKIVFLQQTAKLLELISKGLLNNDGESEGGTGDE